MKIIIIGQGNVAVNLQHAWRLQGIEASMVSSREGLETIDAADVYIYAVADHALREVASKVHAPKALHLHTSGTIPLDVFGADKPHCGVIYFFQTFSKEQLIDDWQQIPVFVEGHDIDDLSAVYTLAQTLSSNIYEASQHDRERLHIAGVFANNFSNLMYRMASEVLSDTQIPFRALLPLIDQTAAKVHTLSPEEAQTGPAKRKDKEVIAHHLSLLTPELREVYQLLSDKIR